uniref:Uncharacterized protein n=1 Tax=Periophthalmus magnuspinnatus TaxID=409849 RepID=A0A3B4A874_9GOBI
GQNQSKATPKYALCALGVGLVALGIVMIVWSVVPADPTNNNNNSNSSNPDPTGKKSKASSVAFVLVGCGVAILLLSMCLGMRNKQREQQFLQHRGAGPALLPSPTEQPAPKRLPAPLLRRPGAPRQSAVRV